ncbi:MAG: hypothetical protein ACRDZ9_09275 [Acidimicrobiales bacterium]
MAPATAVVSCNDEDHRITWRRGKLVLEDHDLAAEEAVLALGGSRCPCLQVLQLWRNLHSWAMSAEIFRSMSARLGPDRLLAPGPLGPVHELGLILTWERSWRRLAFFGEHQRLIEEQVRKRATGPLRHHLTTWRHRVGCRRISSVEVQLQRSGRPAMLTGVMDTVGASATATLGVAWVLGVWARGLAVVDGAFVLDIDAETASSPSPRARAVRWESARGEASTPVAAPARLSRDARGEWQLAWERAP